MTDFVLKRHNFHCYYSTLLRKIHSTVSFLDGCVTWEHDHWCVNTSELFLLKSQCLLQQCQLIIIMSCSGNINHYRSLDINKASGLWIHYVGLDFYFRVQLLFVKNILNVQMGIWVSGEITKLLNELHRKTGYPVLLTIDLLFWGHSAIMLKKSLSVKLQLHFYNTASLG